MIRRPLSAVVTALALLALLPLGARAADTRIDFEAIPNGVPVGEQYAGVGVHFDTPSAFGMPAPPYRTCGSPYTGTGGINGRSASIVCRGIGEFDGALNVAFGFDDERRAVSFKLKSLLSNPSEPVEVAIYGIGGRLLEQRVVQLPRNVVTDVRFGLRGTADIVAVRIVGPLLTDAPTGPVYLDDVVAPIEVTGPQPKFSLALPSPSVEVYEGSSVEVPVRVLRYNGSTGPVSLSVPGLPAGISGTVVNPNPVSGRDPAILRITAASPLSGDRQIPVRAAAAPGAPASVGTAIGTGVTVTVKGLPALSIDGNVNPEILVPRCSGPLTSSFNVRGNYFGTVHVSAQTLVGSVTPGAPSDLRVFGDGRAQFSQPLSFPSDGAAVVRITLTPDGATPVSAEFKTRTVRVSSARWGNDTVADNSPAVVLRGSFPISCPVTFFDDANRAYPVTERSFQDGQDVLTLGTPAGGPLTAPSGLRVLAADGTVLDRTPPLRATSFRNTYSLRQPNDSFGGGSSLLPWEDFVKTWGEDDAYSCLGVCIRDPIAVDYRDTWLEDAKQYGGLCFGWSTMGLRFAGIGGGPLSPAAYEPNARRGWELTNFAEGTTVKRDVTRYQYLQFDRTLHPLMANPIPGPASMSARLAEWRQLAKNAIARDGGVMTVLWSGTSGHAVVAYRVVDNPGGGFTLAIADPNAPYSTQEETSTAARTTAVGMNTIVVRADGTWTGTNFGWSGTLNTLGFVPNLPVLNAQLPTEFSLTSIFRSGGKASIAAIESRGAQALEADGSGRPGSGVTLHPGLDGSGSAPSYAFERGRSYELMVRGSGSGDYGVSGLGGGANAVVTGAGTKPGQQDRVTITPGKAQLGFAPGGDSSGLRYSLVEAPSRTVRRTVEIATSARRGGGDAVALAGGELSIVHRGAPATVAVTLGSLGAGLPGSVQLAPLRVGRGERIALKPASWADLNDGVRLVVRNARGRVVRRATAKLRATRAVALASLTASARAATVTVGGNVRKRGASPVLAVRVETLGRGGRVAARRSSGLRGADVKAGRFALKVAVPRLRRGTRVRVTATLLDEEAGLASVRRTVTVRAR